MAACISAVCQVVARNVRHGEKKNILGYRIFKSGRARGSMLAFPSFQVTSAYPTLLSQPMD